MKRLLFYFLSLCTLFCLSANNSEAQTPVVSLSSNGNCTGSTLTVSSSMGPAIVIWKLNGSAIQTNNAIWNANAVTVAGGNGSGIAANQLDNPFNAYVDASGNVYVADEYNYRVQRWANGASFGTTVAGGNGWGAAANQLSFTSGVVVDGTGNVYVADYNNARVQKWTPGATTGTTAAGGNGTGPASNQIYDPYGGYLDGNGNLYVADYVNERIQKWTLGATSGTTVAGGNGTGAALNQLNGPQGFSVDPSGNIYIADQYNARVVKWAPGATTGTVVAGGNGIGQTANQFDNPTGVYVDGAGDVYVADRNNHRIQFWAPGATTGVTVAGSSTNLPGSSASLLNQPTGVFVDSNGNIYVSDYANARVQKFTPNSSVNNTYVPTTPGSYTATVITFRGTQATTSPVVISAAPTITLGTYPTTCVGSTSSSLPYSATTASPTTYSIVYNAAAVSAGFINVTNASLPASSIPLTIPATAPAASYMATISVSASGGCASVAQSFSITLTAATSSPSISISPNTTSTICSGTTVTFTAVPVNGGISPSYQWQLNSSNVGTNSPNYTNGSLANGDAVTCVLTSNAPCIATNTATSNAINFTVNALPTISLTNNNPTVCPGQATVDLPFVLSGGPTSYSVVYGAASLSAGFVNVTNASITNPIALSVPSGIGAGSYPGTIMVSTPGSCTSLSQSFTITVSNGSIPTINSVSNQALCSGSNTTTITFSGSSVSGTNYLWVGHDSTIGLNPNGVNTVPSFTATTTDSLPHIDTIVVTPEANGCTGTSTSFTITVNPIPKLTSSISPPSICSGTPFVYAPTSSTPGATFSWSRAAITGITNPAASGANSPNEILNNVTGVSIGVVYVDTVKANGCENTQFVVVFVKPPTTGGVIDIRPSSTICSGGTPQSFGTTLAPPTGGYYVWSATNAVVWAVGAGTKNCLVFFPSTGTAVVTLTTVSGGSQCSSQTSDTFNIVSTASFNDTVIYHHNQFICLDNIANSYQWGYDDATNLLSTVLIGEVNQNYINSSPDLTHNYYWVIITHGGCVQKIYYNLPPTGLISVTKANADAMKVFPNPATDIVNVELNDEPGAERELLVSDVTGKVIMTVPVKNDKSQLNISGLSEGFYIITSYSNGSRTSSARFIKN